MCRYRRPSALEWVTRLPSKRAQGYCDALTKFCSQAEVKAASNRMATYLSTMVRPGGKRQSCVAMGKQRTGFLYVSAFRLVAVTVKCPRQRIRTSKEDSESRLYETRQLLVWPCDMNRDSTKTRVLLQAQLA